MSIKEIAERHAAACVDVISDGWGESEDKKVAAEIAPHIERAIREAAQPLVTALERCGMAMDDIIPACEYLHHNKKDQDHGLICPPEERFKAALTEAMNALAEWRASK